MNAKEKVLLHYKNGLSSPVMLKGAYLTSIYQEEDAGNNIVFVGMNGVPLKYAEWEERICDPNYWLIRASETMHGGFFLITEWMGFYFEDEPEEERMVFKTTLLNNEMKGQFLEQHSRSSYAAIAKHLLWNAIINVICKEIKNNTLSLSSGG